MSASPQLSKATTTQPGAERRRSRRRPIVDEQIIPVTFEGDNGGLVLDLGENGVAVQAVSPLQPGRTTEMAFLLPETRVSICAVGDVRWAEPSGRAGIRLLAFSKGSPADIRAALQAPPAAPPSEPRRNAAPTLDAEALQREMAARGLEREAALAYLAERTRELAGASGVAIALGPAQEMMCRASAGAAPPVGVRVQSESGLSGECVRTGLLVRCDDTQTDARVDAEVCRQLDLRSAVLVPIVEAGKLRGVFEIFSNRPHAFSSDDIRRFEQVAALIARFVREPAVAPAPPPDPVAATPTAAAKPVPPVTAEVAEEPAAEMYIEPESEPVENVRSWSDLKLSTLPRRYVLLAGAAVVLAVGTWAIVRYSRWTHPAAVPAAIAATPAPPALETVAPAATAPVVPAVPVKQDPARQEKEAKPQTSPATTVVADEDLQVRQLPTTTSSASQGEAVVPPLVATAGALPQFAMPAATPAQPRPPSTGVVPGRLVRRVNPVYPELARRTRIAGMVQLTAIVRPDGKVGAVQVVSGNALLVRAAVDAVRQWRYEPFRLNGSPVQAEVTVRLDFNPELRNRR